MTSAPASNAAGAPIGVFDSGVGGLTVLRALMSALPNEQFVYLGDTARLPYGTKSRETVAQYAVQAARKLFEYDVKLIVIACNTASTAGLSAIRAQANEMPVIGVIEPSAAAACRASRTGRIVVAATEGTIHSGTYQQAIGRIRPDARISACAAPLWVAIAEEGLTEGAIAESLVRHYLGTVFPGIDNELGGAADAHHPDTLVLGCTHFPMLSPLIRRLIGPHVSLVDSAETTARAVLQELLLAGLAGVEARGPLRLLATDNAERFARVGSAFLGRMFRADEVELVDLAPEGRLRDQRDKA